MIPFPRPGLDGGWHNEAAGINQRTEMLSLADLGPGDVVKVAQGIETGRRLSSLGLVAGTEVRIVRRAPMGDPLEMEVRGCRICLRADQLRQVLVERVS